jgi:hypothetical protein
MGSGASILVCTEAVFFPETPSEEFTPNEVVGWPLIDNVHPRSPLLLALWSRFIDECNQASVQVREVQMSVIRNNVFITAEVARMGTDYGEVFWHGYADETDSWGNGRLSSDGESVVSTSSQYSDRGQDKIAWFKVIASMNDMRPQDGPTVSISTGLRENLVPWPEISFVFGRELSLIEILRQPGPGCLAYTWNSTDNPMWH